MLQTMHSAACYCTAAVTADAASISAFSTRAHYVEQFEAIASLVDATRKTNVRCFLDFSVASQS